jgi:hypothetical protein
MFSSYYHYIANQMWWPVTIIHDYLSKFYKNKSKNLYLWLRHVLKVTTILLIQPHLDPKLLFMKLLLLFKNVINSETNIYNHRANQMKKYKYKFKNLIN